jgi:hypothetical protein
LQTEQRFRATTFSWAPEKRGNDAANFSPRCIELQRVAVCCYLGVTLEENSSANCLCDRLVSSGGERAALPHSLVGHSQRAADFQSAYLRYRPFAIFLCRAVTGSLSGKSIKRQAKPADFENGPNSVIAGSKWLSEATAFRRSPICRSCIAREKR